MARKHGTYVFHVKINSIHGSLNSQEYWSLLDGDEYGSWADARLTDVGISQAKAARTTWEEQLKHNIPTPESYYVSPLIRCCATAQVTFDGLDMPLTKPFRPIIKEVGCIYQLSMSYK